MTFFPVWPVSVLLRSIAEADSRQHAGTQFGLERRLFLLHPPAVVMISTVVLAEQVVGIVVYGVTPRRPWCFPSDVVRIVRMYIRHPLAATVIVVPLHTAIGES